MVKKRPRVVTALYQEKPLPHGTCAQRKGRMLWLGDKTRKDQWERRWLSLTVKALITVA